MKYGMLLIGLLFIGQIFAQTVPLFTGSSVLQKDAQLAVDFHNKVRKDVGASPLQWSEELAIFAQAWADHLASQGCNMQHRPYSGEWKQIYGENIYWGSNPKFSVLDASKKWYSEINDYTYGTLSKDNWSKTGHYTQMVWRTTTRVGMGIAKCKDGGVIVVANYNPAGNTMGQKPY